MLGFHDKICSGKKVFASILCGLLFQCVIAQITVSGEIVDENNEPLPFVHLRIEKTNIGTVSNAQGFFSLISDSNSTSITVVISNIGYTTKTITLTGGYHTIILSSSVTQLTEVTLVAKDYGKELIQKVIKAIPKNYPNTDEQHTGFFRETTTWDNNKQPIYIAEAVIDAEKKTYAKTSRSGDVKLVEFRKYASEQLDSLRTRIKAGSHHIHRFDIVSRREAFLSNPNAYTYKIKDTLRQNGNDIYKVYFEKKEKVSGHVYIMAASFAIIKADFNHRSYSFFDLANYPRQFMNYTTTYEQGEDKIWRFKHSYYKTAFKQKDRILNLVSEYVTTDIKNKKADIPYLERLQFNDILLHDSKAYKANFWDNYNIISPDDNAEALFGSIDYSRQNKDQNRSNKTIDFLKRLTIEMTLNQSFTNAYAHELTYNNSALNIQTSGVATEKLSWGLIFSFFYQIKPNFHLGYLSEDKIFKTGITSHDLVVSSQFNLNPNGRPIFISPRFNLGYQELDFLIGGYNVEEEFKIAGTTFNSNSVDAFLSQRGFRIKPNISLIIEKNKRISFLVSMGYNVQLNTKEGLLIQEKDGFFLFRKKSFLENGEDGLIIENRSNNLLEDTISIGIGISFKL